MPLSILPIAIPLVYGTEGAAVDVSALKGEKSILLSGSFQGQYILLGSHDDINFKPLFAFAGTGVLSIKQILKESIHSVRFRSLATGPVGMTASISGESVAGSNDFVTLPIVLPGGYGQQPIVDLFALAPPSGLLRGTNIILSGNFMGMVTVDGSLDGFRFSPIGAFRNLSLPGLNDGLQPTVPEHEPLIYTEQVRYVRINVMTGTFVSTPLTITIGGEVAVSVGSDSYLSEPMTNASGTLLLKGEVVRISTDDAMTRALADVPANIRGLVGVMLDSAAIASIQEVVSEGKCFVLLEPGLVPVAGDPIWVSPTIAGRATNVLPALDAGLGVIKDASMYAATGGVVADVDPAPTASVLAAFTLATTYSHGAITADQTMTLNDANGGGITILAHATATANVALLIDGQIYTDIAGTREHVKITAAFDPTAGNAGFITLDLDYTINQQAAPGPANGPITGLLVHGDDSVSVLGRHELARVEDQVGAQFKVYSNNSTGGGIGTVRILTTNIFAGVITGAEIGGSPQPGQYLTVLGGGVNAPLGLDALSNPYDGSVNSVNLHSQSTLVTAVGGDHVCIGGDYTIDQTAPAAVGTVTGIKMRAIETAVVGTHNLMDLGVGAGSRFLVGRYGGTALATPLAPGEPDIAFGAGATAPEISVVNTGRLGYELAGQRFMASSNAGAWVPLLTGPAAGGFTARYVPFGGPTGQLVEDAYFQWGSIYHTLLLGSAADETAGRSSLAILASGAISQVLASTWNAVHVQGSSLDLTAAPGGGTSPVTEMSLVKIDTSTITSSGGANIVTTASSLTITGAPIAAGGAAITNPLAFWVQSGRTVHGATFATETPLLHLSGDNTNTGIVFQSSGGTARSYLMSYGDYIFFSVNRRPDGTFSNAGACAAGINLNGTAAVGTIDMYSSSTNGAAPLKAVHISQYQNTLLGIASDVSAASRFQVQADKTIAVPAALDTWKGINFKASTLTLTGGAVAPSAISFGFVDAPTISGAYTIPTAATWTIAGPPVAAGATITSPLALWVQSGNVTIGSTPLVAGTMGTNSIYVNMGSGGEALRLFSGNAVSNVQLVMGRTASDFSFGVPGVAGQFFNDALPGDACVRVGSALRSLLLGNGTANNSMIAIRPTTVASAAGAVLDQIKIDGSAISITGNTGIATAAGFNKFAIYAPTYTGDTATCAITSAATVYFSGAPIAGANVTIANPYTIWSDAGNNRFDGNILLAGIAPGADAVGTLAMSNGATAPTTSVDLCHLYCADAAAGHATLGIFSEEVVAAIGVKLVTEYLPVVINGVVKNIALVA